MRLIEILEAREEALDVHEVADLLNVSERHIYELAADGSLPSFRVGKVVRFDPQDVADWLRQKKPSDNQRRQRKPERHEHLKANRGDQANVFAARVWRNKISSLEAALAMDTSGDSNPLKNS